MCLYAKGKIKKAEEDIVCYKYLSLSIGRNEYGDISSTWCSPYINIGWEIGKVKEISDNVPCYDYGCVTYGFFHTFKNLNDTEAAKNHYDFWNNSGMKQLGVFKCIIPKGTLYYEGVHNSIQQYEGYASRKLLIVERVKE